MTFLRRCAGFLLALSEWFRDPYIGGLSMFATLTLGGCVAIAMAWRGAARTVDVPLQTPWVMSGGLTGVALVGVGLSLFAAQVRRKQAARRRRTLDSMLDQALVVLAAPSLSADAESDSAMVIAGAGVYHSRDCRYAQRRGLKRMKRSSARVLKIRPCKVCRPSQR